MVVGESQVGYLLVRGAIYLFRYFGFLSLIYFFFAALIGGVPGILAPFSLFVEIIGIIELVWYLGWSLPYRAYLQRKPGYKPLPLTRAQRQELFRKSLEFTPDIELSLRKWLRNAHMEDIRRENVKDWLLWALFDKEESNDKDAVELENYTDVIQEQLNMRIKPGRGDAEALRLNFDPVTTTHRNLFYYMVRAYAVFRVHMGS